LYPASSRAQGPPGIHPDRATGTSGRQVEKPTGKKKEGKALVESTFAMVKAKCRDHVRSKTDTAMKKIWWALCTANGGEVIPAD
jgi:hypothetical protein